MNISYFGWILCPYSESREERLKEFYFYKRIGSFCIAYNPYPKYERDKVFGDKDGIFFLTDGVIFNWEELKRANVDEEDAHVHESYFEHVETSSKLYQNDSLFFSHFDGSFNGLVIDTMNERVIAYTNHVGEREVFYCENGPDGIWITSNYNILNNFLIEEMFKRELDTYAFRSMVVFGGMHDNRTWIKGIKRLLAGQFLEYSPNRLAVKQYHQFNSEKVVLSKSINEWIEILDSTFYEKLQLYLKKDMEYGYKTLIDISGGLDSRMVLLGAKRVPDSEHTAICFSAINSNEKKVAEIVVQAADCPYIFSSLSDAKFIFDISSIVKSNYGLTYYIGITGGKRMLEQLNLDKIGLELTGLLGEMASGGYIGGETEHEYKINYSINPGNDHFDAKTDYPNVEMFYFHTRGPLWGLGSMMIRRKYLESYSPFMNTTFLEISHSIPFELREDGFVFLEWMKKRYPEAASIPYAADMCPPNASNLRKKMHRSIIYRLPGIKRRIIKKMSPNKLKPDVRDMNPLDDWYKNDINIRVFINDFISNKMSLISNNDDLKDIYNFFRSGNGNVLEKCAYMTALEATELYTDNY